MSSQYNGKPNNILQALPSQVGAPISASTNASPILVTTSTPHLLTEGDLVIVEGHQTNTSANGRWVASIVDASNLLLVGSTGNGVGGATGHVRSLGLGPTYQIPGDGDKRNAASVDVALKALGDRTAFLAAELGGFKRVRTFSQLFQDDVPGQATAWAAHTFAAGATWEQLVTWAGPTSALNGDIVTVALKLSAQVTDATNSTAALALYADFEPIGTAFTYAKVPASAQSLGKPSANAIGITLFAQYALSLPGPGNVGFALYGTTASGTPGGVTLSLVGDAEAWITHYRRTDFYARECQGP